MNTYVFDPQEEEIGCCYCLVTPNGLKSLSAQSDLISNNLTPAVPTSIVIKIWSPTLAGTDADVRCATTSTAIRATDHGLPSATWPPDARLGHHPGAGFHSWNLRSGRRSFHERPPV